MSAGGGGEGFLSRWSRRKREQLEERAPGAAQEPQARQEAAPETSDAAPAAPAETGAPDAQPLSEEELAALPPLESIDASTDISAFLKTGVPAALRNAALRRAWASDPRIATYLDPARDYAWDWNVPGGVPGSGPLAADFDAKALAEKLFRGSSTKDEEEPAPGDRDIASQTAPNLEQNDGSATAPVSTDDDVAEARQQGIVAPKSSDPLPGQEIDATATLAARSAESAPKAREIRPKSRRHGGAKPL